MEYRKEKEAFDKLCKHHNNNPYQAINYLSRKARKYAEKYDNVILHSEALTCALLNEIPNSLDLYTAIKGRKKQRDILADNVMQYVDDEGIKSAVRSSIRESIHANHLIYIYDDSRDENRMKRIRILTNIIWNQLYHYKKE